MGPCYSRASPEPRRASDVLQSLGWDHGTPEPRLAWPMEYHGPVRRGPQGLARGASLGSGGAASRGFAGGASTILAVGARPSLSPREAVGAACGRAGRRWLVSELRAVDSRWSSLAVLAGTQIQDRTTLFTVSPGWSAGFCRRLPAVRGPRSAGRLRHTSAQGPGLAAIRRQRLMHFCSFAGRHISVAGCRSLNVRAGMAR